MAPKEETRILFIPYNATKGSTHPGPDGQISQQMHAAREYHRKAKEKKRKVSIKSATGSTLVAKIPSNTSSNIIGPVGFFRSGSLPKTPGAGSADPFDVFPVSNLPAYVCEVLHYSVTAAQPIYEYCNPNDSKEDRKRYYMGRAMYSPASLYGVILNVAGFHDLKRFGSEVPQTNIMLRLKYKVRFLELMNQEIQKYGPQIPDNLLYAMLGLTAYGSAERLIVDSSEPKPSVLATAHDLNYYSRLPCEWAHLRALYSILKQRGGLAVIPRRGFAIAVSLMDLMVSFQRFQSPFFPPLETTQDVMSTWPSSSTAESQPCSTLGTGFLCLSNDQEPMNRLFMTLNAIIRATTGYIHFLQKVPTAPTLHHIVRARTAIQHDLLSLPSSLRFDSALSDTSTEASFSLQSGLDDSVYNLIHLAAHAYMLQTLYPLPKGYGPHAKIGALILLANETYQNNIETRPHTSATRACHQNLLLWSAILAGMIAKDGDDLSLRPRLASMTAMIASQIFSENRAFAPAFTIQDWPNVKSILSQFLWLDAECDEDGYEFWVEVCNISTPLIQSPESGMGTDNETRLGYDTNDLMFL